MIPITILQALSLVGLGLTLLGQILGWWAG